MSGWTAHAVPHHPARYTLSELAFLSACHTVVGHGHGCTVLRLAVGMQFAGFNEVIGTLWRVGDLIAHHEVAIRFYIGRLKYPDIGFERAAAALNVAFASQ